MNTSSFLPISTVGKCQWCMMTSDFLAAETPGFPPYIRIVVPHERSIRILHIIRQIYETYSTEDFVE